MTRTRLAVLLACFVVPAAVWAGASMGTPQAPGIPQQIGTDGGVCGVLTFNPGACLRAVAVGSWGYDVCGLPDGGQFPDAGGCYPLGTDGTIAMNLATGAARTFPDAGSVLPDGGTPTWPPWNYLWSGDYDPFCLNGPGGTLPMTTVYACSLDGGVFNVSARYVP